MSGTPHPGPPAGPGGAAPASGAPGNPGRSSDQAKGSEARELWPRDFGRDGVSGLVTVDRAMRARDVSRPQPADEVAAEDVLADLLARIEGRPRSDARHRPDAQPRPNRPAGGGGAYPPVPHPPPQRGESESRS